MRSWLMLMIDCCLFLKWCCQVRMKVEVLEERGKQGCHELFGLYISDILYCFILRHSTQ